MCQPQILTQFSKQRGWYYNSPAKSHVGEQRHTEVKITLSMSWTWEMEGPPTSLTSAPLHLSWKHIRLHHIVEEISHSFGRFLHNCSLLHRKHALPHAKVKFCVPLSSQGLLLSPSLGLGHRDGDYYQSANIIEYPMSGWTGQNTKASKV